MKEIDTTSQIKYKISDLFSDLERGKCPIFRNLADGNCPVIAASMYNQGITGYYDVTPKYSNKLTVSLNGVGSGYFSFHQYPFTANSDCGILHERVKLSKYIALYLCGILNKLGEKFGYGEKVTKEKLFKQSIPLPSKMDVNGKYEPDWNYMEDYIKSIEKKVQFSLSSKAEKENIDCRHWKEFLLGGANGLFYIKKGSRLTKADMKDGNIHFIGATSFNNGITNLISNNGKLHPKNTITVNYNGSVGEAFYQNDKFWASDDVNVLYPKFHMNKNIALFIIPLIKFAGLSYKFIDKWKLEDMENTIIYLPVDEKGNPDWNYMESYITQLKEKAIKRLNNIKSL